MEEFYLQLFADDGMTEGGDPVGAGFDLAEAFQSAGWDPDEALAGEIAGVLQGAGVSDHKMANRLAHYALTVSGSRSDTLYKEAVASYGGTADRPGDSFLQAVSSAARALEAIERHVPGVRRALSESGSDCDVRLLRAFALLGDFVGEDGNFMGGGSPGKVKASADDYFPNSRYY